MLTIESATSVRPSDSFDHWHQITCRKYSLTQCRRVSDCHFSAQILTRNFGPLTLSDTSSSTPPDDLIRITRGPDEIRSDPRDHFMLLFMVRGSVGLVQDGREARMQTGDLAVYDQSQPFTLEFGQQSNAIVMTIPRPLLTSRLADAHRLTGRRIASDSRLGILAGTIVHQLVQLEGSTRDEVVCRLGTSAVDILATTLEAEFTDAKGLNRERARRLDQVKQYILKNMHDCDLDIDTIANTQSMGTRTLNRLFALEGTTPIRWLWQQRLAASYKALAEGSVSHVTDAAMNFGFSDLSHFSRAFKKAFGQTPHTLMRRVTTRSNRAVR
jgi:AraC-like DNA-binding protein